MARTVGPFEVESFLARGGMGAVYIGNHVVEGHRAAIKVVPAGASRLVNEAFLREVRAAASLNHRCIVAVYDYGEVTDTEARASDGEFEAGSFWFAMEYASAGTLEQPRVVESWPSLRRVILEILDALAHAHARGVIHRDLKPANVLLNERDGTLELLLADFGIAHVVDPDSLVPERTEDFAAPNAGTPRYMAPEQIRAAWRDLGPWTDLYALGCVAWELATGEPLFDATNPIDVAMAHMTNEPPPLVPRFEVPPHFEPWLRTLLQKSRPLRFQRAADAAFALSRGDIDSPLMSGEPAGLHAQDPLFGVHTLATMPTLGSLDVTLTERVPSLHMQALRSEDEHAHAQIHVEDLSVPVDWRPIRAANSVRARTGLGLFGLREIPVLGREKERDRIWEALRATRRTRRTTAMIIEGTEGRGKSKLLRWLAVRADELGLATVMRVGHMVMPGPSSGLPTTLARHLGCLGLNRIETFTRIGHALKSITGAAMPDLAAALTEVIKPHDGGDPDDGVPVVQFGSPLERYAAMARYLKHEASIRPVLLLVDNVQWGADAVGFVRHLLTRTSDSAPILVVMAVQPHALAQNPLARRRVEGVASMAGVQTVALDTLPTRYHVELIREQIGLAAEIADELVAVAGNDTNYSLAVIGDWVLRGSLRPTPEGYRFVAGADVQYPADVIEAWDARIDRFGARFALPARVEECLEIAAALGEEVDIDEWRDACEHRSLDIRPRLVERLIDLGLARRTDTGFGFVQSAIVEALRRRAEAHGRWADIHRDCAHVIRRAAQDGASAAERRSVHLLAAGLQDAALEQLRRAIDARLDTSAYDEAVALADLYLDATRADDEEAALVVRARRADALRFLGRGEDAEAEAEAIIDAATVAGSARGRAEGLRVLAGLDHGLGDAARGIDAYTRAIAAFREIDDKMGVARCAHGCGWLRLNSGDFDGALEDFRLGVELADAVGADVEMAWSQQGLAEAAAYAADTDRAWAAANAAREEFRRLGTRSGEGMALTSIANVERDRGDLRAARVDYESAINLLQSLESQLVGFALLHLVATEVLLGTTEAAERAIERARELPLPPPFQVVIQLAECLVTSDPEAFDAGVATLRGLVESQPGTLHPLVARLLASDRSTRIPERMAALQTVLA